MPKSLVSLTLFGCLVAQILDVPTEVNVTIGLLDDFADNGFDAIVEIVVDDPLTVRIDRAIDGFLEISPDATNLVTFSALNLNNDATGNCQVTEKTVLKVSRKGKPRSKKDIDINTACQEMTLSGTRANVNSALSQVTYTFEDGNIITFTVSNQTDIVGVFEVKTNVERKITTFGIILTTIFTICCVCACCCAGAYVLLGDFEEEEESKVKENVKAEGDKSLDHYTLDK